MCPFSLQMLIYLKNHEKKKRKMNATSIMATIVLKYKFLQLFMYKWTYSFKNLFHYACNRRLASSLTLNCWVSDRIYSHFRRKHTDTTYRRNDRARGASAMELTILRQPCMCILKTPSCWWARNTRRKMLLGLELILA